ncbi:MAG: glycerate kinase [Acidimicrobiales bacterium]
MGHLVAAPDKFRGTASAIDVSAAIAEAARLSGWTAAEVPLSDGGEGLLDAIGGSPRTTRVPGPLGHSVAAEWRLLPHLLGEGPVAVIETSRAVGRGLLPRPTGDDPVRADTAGVGHLLLAARSAGARRIVVGCGGSATTDGGWGLLNAVGSRQALAGIELIVACDVTTAFRDAAIVFGPQKGASRELVERLTRRLISLAERYKRDFGVDVDGIPGAGAAGGLAGGLAVLGARLVPGFDLVADMVGLPEHLDAADLVVTGEGHLDPPSFQGKVPGGVLALANSPVLCVVGAADPALARKPPPGLDIIDLTERYGPTRARSDTCALITEVTVEFIARFCP